MRAGDVVMTFPVFSFAHLIWLWRIFVNLAESTHRFLRKPWKLLFVQYAIRAFIYRYRSNLLYASITILWLTPIDSLRLYSTTKKNSRYRYKTEIVLLFLGFFDSVVDAVRQFAIRVSGKTSALVFTDARIENRWVLTHRQQKRVFIGFCFASTKLRRALIFLSSIQRFLELAGISISYDIAF